MRTLALLVPAAVMLLAAAPVDLSVYVGKPTSEPVGGVAFFRHPLVIKALAGVVPDARQRAMMLAPTGPSGLIEKTATGVKGDGCQAHNCGDHHWTIEVARRGGSAQVCYHDAKTMGERSRWLTAPGKAEMRAGGCFGTS